MFAVARSLSNSLRPHVLFSRRAGLLCPWESPGKNTGVGCHFLLQGVLPIWGSNPDLLHCTQILYHLSHRETPTIFWSLLKFMPIDLVMPSHPLLPPSPFSSIFPSIWVFPNESALRIRWPKHWGFSFSISPSNEYSGLIFFRMNWLDLLAVQGTLKSLLQHQSSETLFLWRSAFFMVQL